ncbi:MAG: MBL fold metallo-hydrolase [bacterium]|nr:MBL fold metallo-hydrolase [bacterium]
MEENMNIEQIEVGQMSVFAYIVSCPETKKAMIIDPGGHEEKLWARVQELGLNLEYIVNTHGHGDHTCGNNKLKELSNAEIVMHEIEGELLKLPEVQAMTRQMGTAPSPPADKTLKDNEILKLGNIEIKTIHTPGHTPGGMCLLANGNLFTGDTLFVGAVGRVDLPGSSQQQFISSIKDRLMTLPDDTVIWPGHDYGPNKTSTIGLEKAANPFVRQILHGF